MYFSPLLNETFIYVDLYIYYTSYTAIKLNESKTSSSYCYIVFYKHIKLKEYSQNQKQ